MVTEGVKHQSPNSEWKVCEMRLRERTDLFGETAFTAISEIPKVDNRELLLLSGGWQENDRFGRLIKVGDAGGIMPDLHLDPYHTATCALAYLEIRLHILLAVLLPSRGSVNREKGIV